MKEQIMAKLFNSEELTTEEMIYIGNNLQGGQPTVIPFNHSEEDILKACGLTKEDFDALNKVMEAQMGKCDEEKGHGFSKSLEKFEGVATSNPKFLRIILMNHIKLMMQSRHPLLSILLGGLGGH